MRELLLEGAVAPARRAAAPAGSPTDADADARLLGHALLLGLVADLLLREGPVGLAAPLFITVLVLDLIALTWRSGRALHREATGWLCVALVFSAVLAWRNADELQALDVIAVLGALVMAAVAMRAPTAGIFATRLRETAWAAMTIVRSAAAGIVPLAVRTLFAAHGSGPTSMRARRAIRATLIAVAVVSVFAPLLLSADPIFASFVALPAFALSDVLPHVFVIGFFSWLVAGWTRGAIDPRVTSRPAPNSFGSGLGMLDITAALGALIVLFAAYVVAQLGWVFGGEAFLQSQTGLTAAEYARRGFFEMTWVAALVVPLLVSTRSLLRNDQALERRHTALALPLLALLGIMLGSALMRMRLYVHLFGLTTDRFYPLVFMGWLVLVLGWLVATVLRGRGATFVAGTVLSGALMLALLNITSPDAIVAQFNVARAAEHVGPPLDLRHLARLSAEAVDVATAQTLAAPASAGVDANAQRCVASKELLRRWGPTSSLATRQALPASWRFWNAGDARALRIVGARAAALRHVEHETCFRVPDNRRYW